MCKDPNFSYGASADFPARVMRSKRTAKEPVNCEFLIEGRLCKIDTEDPEFKRIRKKSCKNPRKNYCCYLCPSQEECRISCDYLDTKAKAKVDSNFSLRIDEEIKEYDNEKKRLRVLYDEGKIGEQSYKAAIDAIDEKLKKLKEAKKEDSSTQGAEETLKELIEPPTETEKPTGLWYLVPFFFGLLGGIIAYVGLKDDDSGMADSMLVFGFVVTVIWIILGIILLS